MKSSETCKLDRIKRLHIFMIKKVWLINIQNSLNIQECGIKAYIYIYLYICFELYIIKIKLSNNKTVFVVYIRLNDKFKTLHAMESNSCNIELQQNIIQG